MDIKIFLNWSRTMLIHLLKVQWLPKGFRIRKRRRKILKVGDCTSSKEAWEILEKNYARVDKAKMAR